jgi:hypothetical protein
MYFFAIYLSPERVQFNSCISLHLVLLIHLTDMASAAFIEPLPVVEFVGQLLGKDVLSRPLSDADRIKVHSDMEGTCEVHLLCYQYWSFLKNYSFDI